MKILHADHFCQEKNFLLIDAKNKLQGIGTLPVIHVVISFYKVKCFYTNACYTSFSFVFTTYTNTLSQHSGFICLNHRYSGQNKNGRQLCIEHAESEID